MNKEHLEKLELAHAFINQKADEALTMSIDVVKMAHQLGKRLEEWKASLPTDKTQEEAAEAQFSPEMHAWLSDYLKIGAMGFADPFQQSKPRLIQEAMKMLQLIPPILTTKEKSNGS